jgi:hypothetical protein
MVDFTSGVMVCRRVRRGEPFPDVLFYQLPCCRISDFTTHAIDGADHEHFISYMLFAVVTLAFLESGQTIVQSKVETVWPGRAPSLSSMVALKT